MALRNPLRPRDDETLTIEPRFVAAADVGKRRGCSWRVVIPAATTRREPPVAHGARRADLETRLQQGHPDLGVLEVRRGWLVGPHGWVRTPRGELVSELSFNGTRTHRMRMPERPLQVERLDGVCLALASDWSRRNYGHFLLDALGRWELFRRAGYTPDDIDHFYCGPPHPSAARLVERLGIPLDRIVRPRVRYVVHADKVLAASFPGRPQNYPEWVVGMLRPLAGDPPGPPTKRLYLPRTTKRMVANQDELLPILDEHGFEIYDPREHDNPPSDFAQAEAVISAHGAGLADVAFCRPGTRVLELLPSDHVYSYWYTVASSAGAQYGYLVGESEGRRAADDRRPSEFDFRVDAAEFRKAVEWAVGG